MTIKKMFGCAVFAAALLFAPQSFAQNINQAPSYQGLTLNDADVRVAPRGTQNRTPNTSGYSGLAVAPTTQNNRGQVPSSVLAPNRNTAVQQPQTATEYRTLQSTRTQNNTQTFVRTTDEARGITAPDTTAPVMPRKSLEEKVQLPSQKLNLLKAYRQNRDAAVQRRQSDFLQR